jgi:hypothetical protein
LQIKYPQTRDAGVYECQINTEPKMSLSYTLNVLGKNLIKFLWNFFIFFQKKFFLLNFKVGVFSHSVYIFVNLFYALIRLSWQRLRHGKI